MQPLNRAEPDAEGKKLSARCFQEVFMPTSSVSFLIQMIFK